MAKTKRLELIKKIEGVRTSKLICLILGDRKSAEPNLNLLKQTEDDLTLYLYNLLEEVGHTEKVDLLIYSRGGNTDVPLKIINLLRKYSKKLGIIVPYRAHSAATMIAIGGDEILMNEVSELGPIDPSIVTPFNPVNPSNVAQKIPIETETILSFQDSMKKDFGLRLRPWKIATLLVQHINPLIIGASYRARSLSRSVIIDFLKYHIKGFLSFIKIRRTTKSLLRSNSHSYAIDINEAKYLGLNVKLLTGDLKKLVWELYKEYENDLKLKDIFNPTAFLGNNKTASEEFTKAILENHGKTYLLNANIVFTKNIQPNGTNSVSWVYDENWIVG